MRDGFTFFFIKFGVFINTRLVLVFNNFNIKEILR